MEEDGNSVKVEKSENGVTTATTDLEEMSLGTGFILITEILHYK